MCVFLLKQICVNKGTQVTNRFGTASCWVHLGSSTWNVLWSWNNNERRLWLL